MVTALDPKQIVSFEEALTRLLIEKGIFTREEFLEMVRVVEINLAKKKQVSNDPVSPKARNPVIAAIFSKLSKIE